MRVSSWKFMGKSEIDTDCIFGLKIGDQNRDEYFKSKKQAKISIDGIVHTFTLSRENFWTTCPELRDSDLVGDGTPIRDLLDQLNALIWKKREPTHFELLATVNGEYNLVLPPLRPAGKV